MQVWFSSAALILLSCAFFLQVESHGILVCPPARAGMNSPPGIKHYPEPAPMDALNECNGSSAGTITGSYLAGSTISVTWDTTILHTSSPGVRIAVWYNDNDTFNSNVLADGVDIGITGNNTFNVTLSSKTCNPCILQWVWQSSEDGGYYLGCSDIAIVSSGAAPPSCSSYIGNQVSATTGATGTPSTNAAVSFVVSLILLVFCQFFA